MNIAVFGINYIGLPLAVLLAQNNNVTIVDSNIEKVAKIKRKENPLKEREITAYLTSDNCNLNASLMRETDYENIDYAFIAVDTAYDPINETFNVSEVEKITKKVVGINEKCLIAIVSSIPVGYTSFLKKKFETDKILYVPEFLTEGQSIKDYQYPTKLIIGGSQTSNRQVDYMEKITELFLGICHNRNITVLYRTPSEAEAIKLFDNTYKAMRASFFTFLKIHSSIKKIDAEKIIEGICLDPAVGEGDYKPIRHGAYYFPVSIRNFDGDSYEIEDPITTMLNNNALRLDLFKNKTDGSDPSVVGIYKIMLKEKYKKSLLKFISQFSARGIKVVIFDPNIFDDIYKGCQVVKSCESFKSECSIILAEKISEELKNVQQKVQLI